MDSKDVSDEENVLLKNNIVQKDQVVNAFKAYTCSQSETPKDVIIDLCTDSPQAIPSVPLPSLNKVLVMAKQVNVEADGGKAPIKVGKPRAPRAPKAPPKSKAEKEFDKLSIPEKINLLKIWNEELKHQEFSSSSVSSSAVPVPPQPKASEEQKQHQQQSALHLSAEERELSTMRQQLIDIASKMQELQSREKKLKTSIKRVQRKVCAAGSIGGLFGAADIESLLPHLFPTRRHPHPASSSSSLPIRAPLWHLTSLPAGASPQLAARLLEERQYAQLQQPEEGEAEDSLGVVDLAEDLDLQMEAEEKDISCIKSEPKQQLSSSSAATGVSSPCQPQPSPSFLSQILQQLGTQRAEDHGGRAGGGGEEAGDMCLGMNTEDSLVQAQLAAEAYVTSLPPFVRAMLNDMISESSSLPHLDPGLVRDMLASVSSAHATSLSSAACCPVVALTACLLHIVAAAGAEGLAELLVAGSVSSSSLEEELEGSDAPPLKKPRAAAAPCPSASSRPPTVAPEAISLLSPCQSLQRSPLPPSPLSPSSPVMATAAAAASSAAVIDLCGGAAAPDFYLLDDDFHDFQGDLLQQMDSVERTHSQSYSRAPPSGTASTSVAVPRPAIPTQPTGISLYTAVTTASQLAPAFSASSSSLQPANDPAVLSTPFMPAGSSNLSVHQQSQAASSTLTLPALRQLLMSCPRLYTQILLYCPLELDEVQAFLLGKGCKVSKAALLPILDALQIFVSYGTRNNKDRTKKT